VTVEIFQISKEITVSFSTTFGIILYVLHLSVFYLLLLPVVLNRLLRLVPLLQQTICCLSLLQNCCNMQNENHHSCLYW